MKIIIAGDMIPTKTNEDLFIQGEIYILFGEELIKLFHDSDFSIANLEGPLTEGNKAIIKSGPCLKGSIECINAYDKLGISMFSIANNHIMDFGEEGLKDTLEIAGKKEIVCVGAGKNRKEASIPYIIKNKKLVDRCEKVGVYACAEQEFTIASDTCPGANAFNALYSLDEIAELKQNCDYCIVLYHGGKEYYRYPAPYVQERCRKMIEKGADVVLCQHSHCIGCYEKWKDGTILYGQGNFLFDKGNNEMRNTGLLVMADTIDRKIEFLPIIKCSAGVRLAEGKDKEEILAGFLKRSEEIIEKDFLEKKYDEFSDSMIIYYEKMAMGIWGRGIAKLAPEILKHMRMPKEALFMLNALQCEAHRDLYKRGLERIIYRRE